MGSDLRNNVNNPYLSCLLPALAVERGRQANTVHTHSLVHTAPLSISSYLVLSIYLGNFSSSQGRQSSLFIPTFLLLLRRRLLLLMTVLYTVDKVGKTGLSSFILSSFTSLLNRSQDTRYGPKDLLVPST